MLMIFIIETIKYLKFFKDGQTRGFRRTNFCF
jgi:hypothetical protein